MADFQTLLEEQKQKQDKDTVAIAEAAQSYSLQIQKENKLGQDFIAREGISKAAVSVVQNFQGDLKFPNAENIRALANRIKKK